MSFLISCCCHASPEAVSVSSTLQTLLLWDSGAGSHGIHYRGCCLTAVTLATITQEETVFAYSSLAQNIFPSGLFPFLGTCSDLDLGFFPLCSFGVSCFSHSPTHRPAQTSSPVPPHTLQGLVLWNMLIIETFHVSVTRHHTWVYLGQAVIWHDNSKQYEGEEINIISWRKLWGLGQIWAFKKLG